MGGDEVGGEEVGGQWRVHVKEFSSICSVGTRLCSEHTYMCEQIGLLDFLLVFS